MSSFALAKRALSTNAAATPILYHYLSPPIPYAPGLALQQRIHDIQLARRREAKHHPDVLLLLQHRPVYTGGRRQKEDELASEQARLQKLGADWIATARGGQTTFHGPGQIVAYPLFDLGRMNVRTLDLFLIASTSA